MAKKSAVPAITAIHPAWALPGARVVLRGTRLPVPTDGPPRVMVGLHEARVVAASAEAISVIVPPEAEGGTTAIRIEELPGETVFAEIGRVVATGIHQVDSPLYDRQRRLYVTQSGGRDTRVPVPLYRLHDTGGREPLAIDVANPTSLALGPDGLIYISSRFDGHVYRLLADDQVELYASELGVATGLAFAPDGNLFVGDRSGSILRISPSRHVDTFASLPSSVAAFHLAFGPDGCLYVAAPTLATRDVIYRITPDRIVEDACTGFGRPQGLAFDSTGTLYVVDALAGAAGLYRVDVSRPRPEPELVVSAAALVGVAFDPTGGVVLASNDTAWRLDVALSQ